METLVVGGTFFDLLDIGLQEFLEGDNQGAGFLATFDNEGTASSLIAIDGTNSEQVLSILVDQNEEIVAFGDFMISVDFDGNNPGEQVLDQVGQGSKDLFFAK